MIHRAFVYGLSAWEIDAGIAYHALNLAHRIACRAFVRTPNRRTARNLNAVRRAVSALEYVTLRRLLARSTYPLAP